MTLDAGLAAVLATFTVVAIAACVIGGFVHLMKRGPSDELRHRETTMESKKLRPNGGLIVARSPCCHAPTYWTTGGIREERCTKCERPIPSPTRYRNALLSG